MTWNSAIRQSPAASKPPSSFFTSDEDNDGTPDRARVLIEANVVDAHVYYVLVHEQRRRYEDFWMSTSSDIRTATTSATERRVPEERAVGSRGPGPAP